MLKNSGQEINEEMMTLTQNHILRNLIQDELIWQQTKKYGIIVTDTELAQDIQSYPYFLNDRGQFDSRNYYQFLNNLRMSPKDFESLRRKQLASNKLKLLVASATQISESELKAREGARALFSTGGDTEKANRLALEHGADILRVHDVAAARKTLAGI